MVREGSGEGRCTHLPYGSNRGCFVISPPPSLQRAARPSTALRSCEHEQA